MIFAKFAVKPLKLKVMAKESWVVGLEKRMVRLLPCFILCITGVVSSKLPVHPFPVQFERRVVIGCPSSSILIKIPCLISIPSGIVY